METLATILVVDDQPDLLDSLELVLELDGYRVHTAGDGIEALEVLESHAVDVILADIAMPRMNGYQLYERVRANPKWVAIPFLFLTARAMDSDIRYGKGLGVDDYLTKPFQPEDLLAAVQGKVKRAQQLAQLSRSMPVDDTSDSLDFGWLRIDPAQHKVWMHGELVDLSAREFALLEHLAMQIEHVLSPEELIVVTHEFEADRVEAGSLLRPLIRSLRRKLGYGVGEAGCIENVRGVGYRLVPPKNHE